MSYVQPSGPVPNDLALFGEAPGYEEQIEGEGFVGRAGQELWAGFERFKIPSREHWYLSNIVKDGLPNNRDPKAAEIDAATPIVLDELIAVKPRVVVTAGAFATRFFLGDVPMANVHGIPHEAVIEGRRYTVVPIYHPAAGLHNKGYLAAFSYDLAQLKGYLDGRLGPRLCNVRIRGEGASDLAGHCSWLRRPPAGSQSRRCGNPGVPETVLAQPSGGAGPITVGLDTEGWPDKPWGLSFTADGAHAYVIPTMFEAALEWFNEWLVGKRVVMHSGLHDLPVLRRLGVGITAYDDTQVLGYHEMLRTGSGVLEAESQNLGTLAYRFLCMKLGELKDLPGVDFATQTIPYTEAVKQYAGEDALATWHLFKVYEQLGIVNSRPYRIDMGQVPLVAEMIAHGMPFDVSAVARYHIEVCAKEQATRTALQQVAKQYGLRDFNPGSHPQVRELLTNRLRLRIRKRTKGGKASTSEKAIAIHAGDPTVKLVQTYRELDKLRGTYLAPLLEELR